MKFLFLNGSLRKNGTTTKIINTSIDFITNLSKDISFEVIHLSDQNIRMCDSCYECSEKTKCWITDDIEIIVNKMIEADAIIYATPVHAFGLNSITQTFLERAGVGYLRFYRPLKNKLAGIIIVGRRYSHEQAWSQLALNIVLNKMILAGAGFPATVYSNNNSEKILDEEGLMSLKQMLNNIFSIHKQLIKK